MKKKNEVLSSLKNFVILLLLAIAFSTSSFLVIKKAMENRNKNETVEKGEEVAGKLNSNQLAIKINSAITLESSFKKGKFGIENKGNNVYDVIVKIYLKDTNELIYTSPKLNPGEKIDEAALDKKINKGSYKCIAYFEAYDGNNNYKGKSGVEINLTIKN
ncbi:MAG: hypothetical protein E7165_01855 [Firmicutes bacterium]|nr:hypothetical protein [Bacillota bacterium]